MATRTGHAVAGQYSCEVTRAGPAALNIIHWLGSESVCKSERSAGSTLEASDDCTEAACVGQFRLSRAAILPHLPQPAWRDCMDKRVDARITRRTLMGMGILGGAGISLAPWANAADPLSMPVIRKKIPSTGELIPAMGIGTNSFHGDNYALLRDLLKRMRELNGSVIDTAAMYGDSEVVIGRALSDLGIRQQMFIATKFNADGANRSGAPISGSTASIASAAQAGFERALMRLQTDHIDLMQAHFLSSVEPLMPLLQKLKKDGKIRYIGITTVQVEQHQMLIDLMRKYPIDFVQVDYSLGNRDAAEMVFPVAQERKIAVMVAVPLGGHMGSLISQASDRQLPSWAADIDVTTWGQFFLKYVISHPAVTCAIPGSAKIEHLEDNQIAGRGRIADAAMRKRMEAFWDHAT
jgi:aryl-alcohol dehydrogenase-like predicted oxidoreductase